ncbi:MAG: pilus assembly protein PilM [Planctomycetota bacterium]
MWTGIDIGHSYIKIIQIVSSLGGFKLVGIAKVKNVLPLQAKYSPKLNQFLRLQIQRIFSENKLIPSECIVGVTGKDINLRIIQMPPIQSAIRFEKMMGYEMMQLGGKSGENLYSDYCKLNLTDKNYPEIPVLVGMAKNTFIDEELKRLRRCGIRVADISPNAIALSHTLRKNEMVLPTETVLLADFGLVNAEIIIHRGEHLIFARNIAVGGQDLTEAIHNRLGIPQEQAESLKISHGKILPRETKISGEDQLLQEALRSGVGQFQSAIESAMSFALAQLKIERLSPDRILISGGSAKLGGLAGYLGDMLNKHVEVFEPFKNIRLDGVSSESRQKIAESACDFSVALGLALSGTSHDKNTHISFLPPHLKKKRDFYKSIFPLSAAGIMIFVGMIIWIISVYGYNSKEAENMKQLKSEQQKFINTLKRVNELQDRKKSIDNNYQKLNNITQTTDLLDVTMKLISQYLSSEAWVSQLTLTPRDPRQTPKGTDSEGLKEIVINGYLEDDNTDNMEKLKGFVDELNQNNDYLPLEASLKRLDNPKVVTPRGKKEFEIVIRIKDKIITAK